MPLSLSSRRVRRACVLLTLALASACHSSTTTATTPAPASTRVVFFDDFNEATLDRASWTPRVSPPTYNDEQQAYVDDTATVRLVSGDRAAGATNGALEIRARARPGFVAPGGTRYDFISGRLDTRAHVGFTYGTASARMKLPAGAGLWPAFWVLGTGDWPATGEIDVMENVGDPSWISAAMHGPGYSGNTPLVRRDVFPPGQDATGWHVYSVDWTANTIVFHVDDREIYRVTRAMVERYGHWAFDNPKYLILNLALGGGYPQGVNGATTPYHGLPASTVQHIQSDSVSVLVDWVRVTQP